MKGCHVAKCLMSLLLVAAARVCSNSENEKRIRQEEEEAEREKFPKDAIDKNAVTLIQTHTVQTGTVWARIAQTEVVSEYPARQTLVKSVSQHFRFPEKICC